MDTEMNMVRIDDIARTELLDALNAIQQPRSDYQIEHFVVGQHDTEAMRYHQCVLEMQIKYDSIRLAQLDIELMHLDIEECDDSPRGRIGARKKRIGLESTERALLGAIREFTCLYKMFKSFGRTYTYEEIQADQIAYWHKRAIRQTEHECQAYGRPQVGQLDMMRQMGVNFGQDESGRHYALPNNGTKQELVSP